VSGASTFELMVRLFLSLAVVIGLMLGITTLLKRRGFAGFSATGPRRSVASAQVEVLARKPLGRNASVAIVRVAGKSMVLGVTEAQVTLLGDAEIDDFELEEVEAQGTGFPRAFAGATPTWKTMLEGLRDRTVRRP
jgi:flagellar protein FliO/FliZ